MTTDPSKPDPEGKEQSHAADDPDPAVLKTVVERYYTRGVESVDKKRERSEKGYAIASAVAATLVATGLLTHLEERPTIVKVLGLVGLSLWLISALLFIYTIAFDIKLPEPEGFATAGEFVQGVANQVREEGRVLKGRINLAMTATVLAVAVTFSSLVAATTDTGASKPQAAQVTLTRAGDVAVAELCGSAVGDVFATVQPEGLNKEIVKLELPENECGASKVIEIPKAEIAADKEVGKFPIFPPP